MYAFVCVVYWFVVCVLYVVNISENFLIVSYTHVHSLHEYFVPSPLSSQKITKNIFTHENFLFLSLDQRGGKEVQKHVGGPEEGDRETEERT